MPPTLDLSSDESNKESKRSPDRRLWLVALAGAVIAGVCWQRVRTNRPYDHDAQVQASTTMSPAPLFEALDERNEMFRLAAYLGRHRMIVVFYDGADGADNSPDMFAVKDHADELRKRDIKIVAVSQAIPQQNRAALERLGEFPGPLVSDVDGSIHQKWGRMSVDGQPMTGLFLIDRKGTVAFHAGSPRPYADFDSLWKDVVHP